MKTGPQIPLINQNQSFPYQVNQNYYIQQVQSINASQPYPFNSNYFPTYNYPGPNMTPLQFQSLPFQSNSLQQQHIFNGEKPFNFQSQQQQNGSHFWLNQMNCENFYSHKQAQTNEFPNSQNHQQKDQEQNEYNVSEDSKTVPQTDDSFFTSFNNFQQTPSSTNTTSSNSNQFANEHQNFELNPNARVQHTNHTSSFNLNNKNCDHPLTLNCLRKCSSWSVSIKLNNKKVIRIPQSAIALRQNGSLQSGPCPFSQDIIDQIISAENDQSLSNTTLYQQQTHYPQHQQFELQKKLHLKEFNGFIHKKQQQKLNLPLNNSENNMNSKCLDILKDWQCESLFCLEFDLTKQFLNDQSSPQGGDSDTNSSGNSVRAFRTLNQQLVESTLHFFINGFCHGQKILSQDLHFQLQGKKIIKSIQQRIKEYKEYIIKNVQTKLASMPQYNQLHQQIYRNNKYKYNNNCNNSNFQGIIQDITTIKSAIEQLKWLNKNNVGPYFQRQNIIHAKMINISRSIGVQVSFANLMNIENFLTNFNQLVLQGGIINKFFFCFDLPLSLFFQQSQGIQQSQYNLHDSMKFAFSPSLQKNLIFRETSNINNSNQKLEGSTNAQPMNLLEEFQKMKDQSKETSSQSSFSQDSQEEKFKNYSNGNQIKQNQYGIGVNKMQEIENIAIHQYQQAVSSIYQSQKNTKAFNEQQLNGYVILDSNTLNHSFYNQHLNINNNITNYDPRQFSQQPHQIQSNLDRFLKATTCQLKNSRNLNFKQFFESFNEASLLGLKVELINEESCDSEIFTFIPTLSSLQLYYFDEEETNQIQCDQLQSIKGPVVGVGRINDLASTQELSLNSQDLQRKERAHSNQVMTENEFLISETQTTNNHLFQSTREVLALDEFQSEYDTQEFMRNEFDFERNTTDNSVNGAQTAENINSFTLQLKQLQHVQANPRSKRHLFEYFEENLFYLRPPLYDKIEELMDENPLLSKLKIKKNVDLEESWFSVVWTCLKSIPLNKQINEGSGMLQNQNTTQFLVFYKFKSKMDDQDQIFDMKGSNSGGISFESQKITSDQMIEVIGLIPCKQQRDSFWLSPIDFDTSDQIQGEIFDKIYEENLLKMNELQERAIEFMKHQRLTTTFDFKHFLTLNCSPYSQFGF